MTTVHFITHPEVVVDPAVPVPEWPLSERGRERMRAMLAAPWVASIGSVFSSAERKAIDGAEILAEHLGLGYEVVEELGENDRSATGYLPPDEFQRTADLFFAHPDESIRGWERAVDAQARIVRAVDGILGGRFPAGDVAIVAHGGVGALLLSHLHREPIDRRFDQPGTGGGCAFSFDAEARGSIHGWTRIDSPDQR